MEKYFVNAYVYFLIHGYNTFGINKSHSMYTVFICIICKMLTYIPYNNKICMYVIQYRKIIKHKQKKLLFLW